MFDEDEFEMDANVSITVRRAIPSVHEAVPEPLKARVEALAEALRGSASTLDVERTRMWRLIDAAVRRWLPIALDAEREGSGDDLRALGALPEASAAALVRVEAAFARHEAILRAIEINPHTGHALRKALRSLEATARAEDRGFLATAASDAVEVAYYASMAVEHAGAARQRSPWSWNDVLETMRDAVLRAVP